MPRRPTQSQIYQRLLARYSREMANAFFAAVQAASSRVNMRDLARAIDLGDTARVVQLLGLDATALFPLADSLRSAFVAGGLSVAEFAPRGAVFGFNGRNTRAEAWVATTSGRMIQNITDDTLPMVRAVLTDGVSRGRSGATIARELTGRLNRATGRREGGFLGLNDQQTRAAINARADLDNLDSRYFSRKLRDRRYDAMVRKAIDEGKPLSQADIDRITNRYKDRMLRRRGEVIARTETHSALASGQHEGIQQALDEGRISSASKAWIHNSANQAAREDHESMGLSPAIPFNAAFTLPSGATGQYPHDPDLPIGERISCRCTARYQIVP